MKLSKVNWPLRAFRGFGFFLCYLSLFFFSFSDATYETPQPCLSLFLQGGDIARRGRKKLPLHFPFTCRVRPLSEEGEKNSVRVPGLKVCAFHSEDTQPRRFAQVPIGNMYHRSECGRCCSSSPTDTTNKKGKKTERIQGRTYLVPFRQEKVHASE